MRHCVRCLLPETYDTVMFDEEGVCSVCRQIEKRNEIDWVARRQQLDEVCAEFRDKGQYDCIVPFSGGKDSVFQLWYIIKELKLKPLVFRFDHWGYRPLVGDNNTKVFKKLGCDVLQFTPNWHVVRELMLEALKRRGDFCWHCHTGVYAHTMQISVKYNIPLIFWGESLAEYASWYNYDEMEEVDEKRFNKCMNLGMTADDMFEFLKGRVAYRDLIPFSYPKRKELRGIGSKSICLGNYIKWDTKNQVDLIKRELDWKGQQVEGIPPEFDYEKIECSFQGVRDYCRYIKRGNGRTNHLANIDIRNGRMSREAGEELVKQYDGKRPASLDWFLEILDVSEDEFYDILEGHQVAPWEFDRTTVQDGAPLPDMDQWDSTYVKKPS